MARVHVADTLRISDYVASINLNPNNVFYQSLESNNISTQGASWQITSPDKRSLLLSIAQIEWKPTYERRLADNTTVDAFTADADKFSMKPLLPFTQSMTSQTVSINGQSLTFSQPRRFSEPISRMLVTTEESKPLYETQWWTESGGNYTNNRPANNALAANIDEGLSANETALYSKILIGENNTANIAEATQAGKSSFTVSHFEPILLPPFNAYGRCKEDMPDWAAHKYQSDVIPNVDRFEFDCQFNAAKIAAGTIFYRYGQNEAAPGNTGTRSLVMTNLQATMHLYWYNVSPSFSIPRSVDLQSWNIREFVTAVDGGNPVANGSLAANRTVTDLLQLRSPPSLILIHAIRRQDDPDYVCHSMVSDSDYKGADLNGSVAGGGASGSAVVANANHSLDPFMQIVNLTCILGDRPNVLSVNFTERELYDITLKNSKWSGFSQSFATWRGPFRDHYGCPANNDADSNPTLLGRDGADTLSVANCIPQLSKGFVALTAADLAERVPPGTYFPSSFQFTVQFRALDGASGFSGGDHKWDCYTHIINSKNFLRVEPDRSSFNEQSLSYGAYEAAIRPDMGRDTPGGALSNLREKVSDYRSRY